VLKRSFAQVPIARPFFDVTPVCSLPEFTAEVPRHPVFLVVRVAA
jgi:hypothetical protein